MVMQGGRNDVLPSIFEFSHSLTPFSAEHRRKALYFLRCSRTARFIHSRRDFWLLGLNGRVFEAFRRNYFQIQKLQSLMKWSLCA